MNRCPGCAEVEIIEILSANEKTCWVCQQIAAKASPPAPRKPPPPPAPPPKHYDGRHLLGKDWRAEFRTDDYVNIRTGARISRRQIEMLSREELYRLVALKERPPVSEAHLVIQKSPTLTELLADPEFNYVSVCKEADRLSGRFIDENTLPTSDEEYAWGRIG